MTERSVFLAALDHPDPAERAAFLDQVCGPDPALRQRVESLLRSYDAAGDFLDSPALAQIAPSPATPAAPTPDSPATPPPVAETQAEAPELLSASQPIDTLRLGDIRRLDHYEVLEEVGRGGMGVVLKARDTVLDRIVAVKVLAPTLAASGTARKRFAREAQSAAAVRDENVVAIHDVQETGPSPYLVMEFITGTTLEERIRKEGPPDLREALRIGAQVAAGLAAAHQQGLIHRDVKPSNILLEAATGKARITDFGLARAADDASLTQSGVIAGTPLYMSPEQARGDVVDHRSDLFSLGSVLYTLFAGRPPFRAGNTMAVLKRVSEETPRPLHAVDSRIPVWVDALVARLHAKDPAQRYQSAEEVADLLTRGLAQLEQAPASRPRRGVWVAVACGVLLLGLFASEVAGITQLAGWALHRVHPENALAVVKEGSDTTPPASAKQEPKPAGPRPGPKWAEEVAALPPREQVAAVGEELKRRNPGFDGKVTFEVANGAVTELSFSAAAVTDITPVRALTRLQKLSCSRGKLSDLRPLRGLALRELHSNLNPISDLSPLQGMPLESLTVWGFRGKDLSPLRGMRLKALNCGGGGSTASLEPLAGMPLERLYLNLSAVSDLSPVAGIPLRVLHASNTRVADLSPLKNMPLTNLTLSGSPVTDLTPIRDLPLTYLECDFREDRDGDLLRSIKTLQTFNERPAAAILGEKKDR